MRSSRGHPENDTAERSRVLAKSCKTGTRAILSRYNTSSSYGRASKDKVLHHVQTLVAEYVAKINVSVYILNFNRRQFTVLEKVTCA
jgi:hypothetical protein